MKNMALLHSDEVEMEEGTQAEVVAGEEAPRERSSQKDDDDYPTDLSWAQLMAQLLHDKQVASNLLNQGVFSFHFQRLATL